MVPFPPRVCSRWPKAWTLPARLLDRAEFIDHIGAENILPNVEAALSRAKDIHESFDGIGSDVARDMLAQGI